MSYTPLNGFEDVRDLGLNNEIQDSLLEYFDWTLLEKGNYFNVNLGETSPNGEDYSKLRVSSSDHYASGVVWEGFRKNWVWQSGIGYTPETLANTNENFPGVSGVYIEGNFEPTSGVGEYAHYIDHFNGKVIFDNAISTGTLVQAEFSYKYINVVYANNMPWYKELQTRTLQPTAAFLNMDKGEWNIPPESRLQLPAIAIEVVPTRVFKGFQLGGGQYVYTDVLFHCLAEDEVTRNKLVDIISLQNRKTVNVFHSNAMNASGNYPLDYRGVPVPSALRYPELIDLHNGGRLRLTNMTVQDMVMFDTNIFGGIVRSTTEGIKLNI
tara:strand:- start:1250 stop:2221 length:972 start_codon:yes stop_codon:yes gene_type:complete